MKHLLFPFGAPLIPKADQIFDMALAGLGGYQVGAPALAIPAHTHSADCPTCNLVEIPYDPNLPTLRM